MSFIVDLLWFLLPAAIANTIPPIAATVFPNWSMPVDFGFCLRGRRLLGANKTIRGFVTGIFAAEVVSLLQSLLSDEYLKIGSEQIGHVFDSPWVGAYLGFAALFGDSVKSIFKRQFDIKPGQPWVPWDQIDWILGVIIFAFPLMSFDLNFIIGLIGMAFALSFLGKVVGYWTGVNTKWI